MYDHYFGVIIPVLSLVWVLVFAAIMGVKDRLVFRSNTRWALALQLDWQQKMFDSLLEEDDFDDHVKSAPNMSILKY